MSHYIISRLYSNAGIASPFEKSKTPSTTETWQEKRALSLQNIQMQVTPSFNDKGDIVYDMQGFQEAYTHGFETTRTAFQAVEDSYTKTRENFHDFQNILSQHAQSLELLRYRSEALNDNMRITDMTGHDSSKVTVTGMGTIAEDFSLSVLHPPQYDKIPVTEPNDLTAALLDLKTIEIQWGSETAKSLTLPTENKPTTLEELSQWIRENSTDIDLSLRRENSQDAWQISALRLGTPLQVTFKDINDNSLNATWGGLTSTSNLFELKGQILVNGKSYEGGDDGVFSLGGTQTLKLNESIDGTVKLQAHWDSSGKSSRLGGVVEVLGKIIQEIPQFYQIPGFQTQNEFAPTRQLLDRWVEVWRRRDRQSVQEHLSTSWGLDLKQWSLDTKKLEKWIYDNPDESQNLASHIIDTVTGSIQSLDPEFQKQNKRIEKDFQKASEKNKDFQKQCQKISQIFFQGMQRAQSFNMQNHMMNANLMNPS